MTLNCTLLRSSLNESISTYYFIHCSELDHVERFIQLYFNNIVLSDTLDDALIGFQKTADIFHQRVKQLVDDSR